MTRHAAPNDNALDAFIAAKAEIDTMLERLKALSDDHFETHRDEIHWVACRDAEALRESAPPDHRQRLQGRRTRRLTRHKARRPPRPMTGLASVGGAHSARPKPRRP